MESVTSVGFHPQLIYSMHLVSKILPRLDVSVLHKALLRRWLCVLCRDASEQAGDHIHDRNQPDGILNDQVKEQQNGDVPQTRSFQKGASFALRSSGTDCNPHITPAADIDPSDQVALSCIL